MDEDLDKIRNKERNHKRLMRLRLRGCIRRVIENRCWLKDEYLKDMQRRSGVESIQGRLNFNSRVSLCQKPEFRTEEDVKQIVNLLMAIKDCQRFGFNLPDLAKFIEYQVIRKGRVIVREGHQPTALYVILSGDVKIETTVNLQYDETAQTQLHPGSMFGDFALLYNKARAATVSAMGLAELLVIPEDVFNEFIRETLMAHYFLLRQALSNFKYFESFDQRDLTEICFYGRVQEYLPGDLVYSCNCAREVTFLIIEGSCDIIELLRVIRTRDPGGNEEFVRYSSQYKHNREVKKSSTQSQSNRMLLTHSVLDEISKHHDQPFSPRKSYPAFSASQWHPSATSMLSDHSVTGAKRSRNDSKNFGKDVASLAALGSASNQRQRSISFNQENVRTLGRNLFSDAKSSDASGLITPINTTMHYNETHLARKMLKDTLATQDLDKIGPFYFDHQFTSMQPELPFEPHFMKIGTLSKSACFNVGENLKNRYIVANCNLIMLEIPKKVLARQRYIVWEAVRRTLDRYLPNNALVFNKFVKDRLFRQWKSDLTKSIFEAKDLYPKSGNDINHVPLSIRIRNDFTYCDNYYRVEMNKFL